MDGHPPIQFFHRANGRTETEQVYGEAFLRWAYERPFGRLATSALLKRGAFSRFYGWLMDSARSVEMIRPFIEEYGLDEREFAASTADFRSFNEFFYRKLKPGARPVDRDIDSVVFPADGRHLGLANVAEAPGVFVKGQRFDLSSLLGDPGLAERFAQGTLVLSRLCPVDYHRFHFPVCGVPGKSRVIAGDLFSVSPIALARRLSYLWENKRVVTPLQTQRFGLVLIVEIGATNVGSIVQTHRAGHPVAKGAEKGYFRFGGSSTITLFEPGRVKLDADLLEQSARHRELYALVGQRMGQRE